mmetsp:Transcript_12588/g.31843  ORF Transcript_12588/g.31843 Transcript_12588/m.31843 type:complete len:206 (+) Transcript_12588:396-1013(+)
MRRYKFFLGELHVNIMRVRHFLPLLDFLRRLCAFLCPILAHFHALCIITFPRTPEARLKIRHDRRDWLRHGSLHGRGGDYLLLRLRMVQPAHVLQRILQEMSPRQRAVHPAEMAHGVRLQALDQLLSGLIHGGHPGFLPLCFLVLVVATGQEVQFFEGCRALLGLGHLEEGVRENGRRVSLENREEHALREKPGSAARADRVPVA